jgi:cytochrome c
LVEGKLVGPSFSDVAKKYVNDAGAPARLAQKVVTGGGGVWSPLAMPPNALINESEAAAILKYVLSLADKNATSLALAGQFTPKLAEGDAGLGSVVVRAVYTDQGEEQATPLTGENVRILRSPTLNASQADVKQSVDSGGRGVVAKKDAWIGFRSVDLTGVHQLVLAAMVPESQPGGLVEIHLDSASGELLGQGKVEPREPGAAKTPSGGTPPRADAPAAGASGASRGTRGAPSVKVGVREVTGKHDLYLVFKNELTKEGARLMTLSNVRLSNERVEPEGR